MNISAQGMRYVCLLATHLHFGKASIQANTSQPNLSVQIKKVESELGLQLFERSNKHVLLTERGKNVVKTFTSVLATLDALQRDCNDSVLTTLKIGLFPTLAPYLLPKIMPYIKKKLPKILLYIVEDKTDKIVEKLNEGALDCILAATPINAPSLTHNVLFEDPFYLAVSKDNELSKHKTIHLSDLNHERIILLEEGHCLRDQALDFCFNDSISIDTSYEASSLETLKAMVAANNGVTLVPKLCLDTNEMLTYIPFNNSFSRKIGLFWRKTTIHQNLFSEISGIIQSQV